jgi:polyhydroxybutyrate depolymerase
MTSCIRKLPLAPVSLAVLLAFTCLACGAKEVGATDVPTDLPADIPSFDVPQPDGPADAPADVPIPESLGGVRPAALFVPDDYTPARAWPLVIALHGYATSGFLMAAWFGLVERVTPMGFVLLAPDGTLNSQDKMFWNAWPSCCNFDAAAVDDVTYLRGLIGEAVNVLSVDPARVYLLGYSNGGFLSLRAACDAADVITGIASLGGSMTGSVPCQPSRPVSILAIQGTADDTIAYDGGSYENLPAHLGVQAVVDGWVQRDKCVQPSATVGEPVDFDAAVAGAETQQTSWQGCGEGARVDLWRMEGSGHAPELTEPFKDAVLGHLLSLSAP